MKFLLVVYLCCFLNGAATQTQEVNDQDSLGRIHRMASNDISAMLIKIYEQMIELQTKYGEVKENEKNYELRLAKATAQINDLQNELREQGKHCDAKLNVLEKKYDGVEQMEKKNEAAMARIKTTTSAQLNDLQQKYSEVKGHEKRQEASLADLHSKTTAQINDLQSKLREQGKHNEGQIIELAKKYSGVEQKEKKNEAGIASIKTSISAQINDLQRKYTQVSVPKWAGGSYCILANGACPPGFRRYYGHLLAINQFAATTTYITQARFGDSSINCHGACGQYGNWVGELHLTTCCK